MFLYFLICLAAFVLVSLFMIWYSRFVFKKIYGHSRGEIDSIVAGGTAPPAWDQKLAKKLSKCRTLAAKEAALAGHRKFAEKRAMDYILFMKRTGFTGSEAEREAAIEKLEAFRRDYIESLEGKSL